jgi:hypothetical protein
MAKTFKVWVTNLVPIGTTGLLSDDGLPLTWDQTTLDGVVKNLKDLFDKVCTGSQFANSDVAVTSVSTLSTTVGSSDLVVRLTRKKDSLVLKKAGSGGEPSGATLDMQDSNGASQGVLSEVWIEKAGGEPRPTWFLANVAFHELMHNKLDALISGKGIHESKSAGGLDGTGLAAATFSASTDISTLNIQNMKGKLASVVTQFTGTTVP